MKDIINKYYMYILALLVGCFIIYNFDDYNANEIVTKRQKKERGARYYEQKGGGLGGALTCFISCICCCACSYFFYRKLYGATGCENCCYVDLPPPDGLYYINNNMEVAWEADKAYIGC